MFVYTGFCPSMGYGLLWTYSRGQAKPTNKNGILLSRKYLYKEIVPENMAGTPKSVGKNTENSAIASFMERNLPIKYHNKISSGKKILNIDPNWAFAQV